MPSQATRQPRRGTALGAALLMGVVVAAHPAAAQPASDEAVLATTLFRQARALMSDGQISDACLRFAESHRLDPGGGTILNLALCREKEGKLAQSWSAFHEALAFARRDRRADREAEATEHIRLLEPRLSRLTVLVPPASVLEGLRIACDGRDLAPASWSLAIPVDAGEHAVTATAPGHEPYAATVALPGEGGAVTVEVPRLSPKPVPAAPVQSATARIPPLVATATTAPEPATWPRPAAWIVGVAGLAQLVAGSYFGLQAMSLDAQDDWMRAGTAADRSTVLFATGLATTVVAAYLFVKSRGHGERRGQDAGGTAPRSP